MVGPQLQFVPSSVRREESIRYANGDKTQCSIVGGDRIGGRDFAAHLVTCQAAPSSQMS